jgi:hypothetical protein
MNHSAISNPYLMEQAPKVRTPIKFKVGKDRAYCYGCGRTVLPKIIDTRFVSKALAICPACNSVIQPAPTAKPEQLPRTRFIWLCDEGHEYSEGARLPVRLNEQGFTSRVCPKCSRIVHLVEE